MSQNQTRYLSQGQIAKLIGISKQAVSKAVAQGRLIRTKMGIDLDHPTNRHFLDRVENQAEPEQEISKKPKRKKTNGNGRAKKTNGSTTEKPEKDQRWDGGKNTVGGYNKTQIDIQKSAAQIQELQLRIDERRKKLIKREYVDRFFSQLYLVDSNEWKTLSDRLSPEIAGIFEIDDPEKILQVSKAIEKEVYRTLTHVKRLVDDFLERMKNDNPVTVH